MGGKMNAKEKKTNKTPRSYLPSVESFSKKKRPHHGKRVRKVVKTKLGKKLWREYYKSIEFISKF